MSDNEPVVEKETVIVERGGAGSVIMAITFLIVAVSLLAYFGILPI